MLFVLFLSLTIQSIVSVVEGAKSSKDFEDTIKCEDEDTWTDEMWQFYTISVDAGDKVIVNLDYKGDLDLDLRLYWKRDNVNGFNGFDLTHCNIDSKDYDYAENSQVRTKNTYNLGESEELVISNPSYTKDEDKIAYVLVFVYSGEGESEFSLTATKELTEVPDDEVYDCNFVLIIIIIYIIAAGIVVGVFALILHRKKMKISGRKEEKVKEKEDEKKQKEIKHFDLDTIVKK